MKNIKSIFALLLLCFAFASRMHAQSSGAIYHPKTDTTVVATKAYVDAKVSSAGGGSVTSVGLSSTDFTVSGSPVTGSGSITANLAIDRMRALIPTAVKTSNYSASANDFVPCDNTSGSFTVTLPTAPADKTVIGVKTVIQSGTNTITISSGGSDVFNKASGSTSLTLNLLNQAYLLEYKSSTAIWYVLSTDAPLSGLDARYFQINNNLSEGTAATVRTNIGAQATLVSGTNLRPVNGNSLLGSTNLVTPDAQRISKTINFDSVYIGITGGDTIGFTYGTDTVYWGKGVTRDSLCMYVVKRGIITRTCQIDSSGGGSALISGLGAAGGANTINNANYQQNWQWNILNGTGLHLSSTSTASTNGTAILAVNDSGTVASSQATYGAYFRTVKNSAGGVGYAGYFSSSGGANLSIGADNDCQIAANKKWYFGSSASVYHYSAGGTLIIDAPTSGYLTLMTRGATGISITDASQNPYMSFATITANQQSTIYGGDYLSGNYRAVNKSAVVLKRNNASLSLCADTSGAMGGYGSFTPTPIVTIYGNNNNAGIGTVTPVASAKLEISTTTQGLLPPRMTTVQRDAISSPATGLTLFCTDCTANDASTGVMQTYNGSSWKNYW